MKRFFQRSHSITESLFRLILSMFFPMLALAVVILVILIVYNAQYSSISSNIITASSFNQDFKNDVDLKMYYFVSGRSDEIPEREIEAARALAESLESTTKNSESKRTITSVLNLCDSLNASIDRIKETDGYDARLEQLESNVYVITQLIQDYVYTYLYHESGEIAGLQAQLTYWLTFEIIIVALIVAIVASSAMNRSMKIAKSITDPIDALSSRVEEIGRGELLPKAPIQAEDEKLVLLGEGIEEMVEKLKAQIDLNQQEQEKLREIELALLQAQINPHFLYNTLDTIVWLIETGKDQEAEEMVTSLSTYFRSFLSNGKDIISLEEELTHVRSYLEIQQVRYKDRMTYQIDSDPAIARCLVPKMTLQPMVENAIYHGIKPKRGLGAISITGRLEDGYMFVCVADTGIGMDPEALETLRAQILSDDSSGFGLLAAYKRLKLMYGEECTFSIESEAGIGTQISFRVPYRTEERHEAIL